MIFVWVGNKAMVLNNITYMLVYVIGSALFSYTPVLFAMIKYWADVWQVISGESYDGVKMWQVS